MAGLLTPYDSFLGDPRNMGLLGAASGLLQAGAPSRTPQNFGGALAQGLMGGVGMYGQAQAQQKADVLTQLQMEKLKRELAQDEAFTNFIKAHIARTQAAPAQQPSTGGLSMGSADAIGAPWAANEPTLQPQPQSPANPLSGALPAEILPLMGTERGKGLLEYWKAANPDVKFEGGLPLDPKTGRQLPGVPAIPQTSVNTGLSTVMVSDGKGGFRQMLVPGTLGNVEAAEIAQQRAKAGFQPFNLNVPGGTQQMPLDVGMDVLRRQYGGGDAAATQSPSVAGRGALGFTPAATETKFGSEFANLIAKADVDMRDSALKAPDLAERANRVKEVISTGKVITGAGADYRLALGKALGLVGASDRDTITNTEQLAAGLAQNTLDAIKASGLGSGTGFSNADRDFLEKAVGGKITLEASTIDRLATLAHRAAEKSAMRWGQRVQQIPETALAGTGVSRAPVTIPKLFTKGQKPSAFRVSPETQQLLDKFAPLGNE